jgi:hypothetical protein
MRSKYFSILVCTLFSWYFQIPIARYLPTWRGNAIDAQMEMNQSRIMGLSISVNAEGGIHGAWSGPGDFKVELDWIKAFRTQWLVVNSLRILENGCFKAYYFVLSKNSNIFPFFFFKCYYFVNNAVPPCLFCMHAKLTMEFSLVNFLVSMINHLLHGKESS